MRTLRTLCSGGELFGVGARAAGYAHVEGYEIDPKIAAVAQRNGFDVRAADVCEVPYETLPPVDHLHISPSCKNASQANQKGKDESGEPLPRETAGDLAVADASCRAIRAHQGATFTLENVWGYRSFESFDRIRAALADAGFSYEYWHLNSADYGVPQTRKRLILIARRGLWRIQRPHPTHRNGGDMFHARWRGWYAAIEDILHTLPPTKPAPWQLARLPKELTKTIIVHRNDMRPMPTRYADEPIFTITAGSFNSSHSPSTMHRAYIVGARKTAAAYLLDGDNARSDTGEPIMRAADEPAMAMRATRATVHRAHISGQWVRMTIQALGRFQTVPDSYQGLTSEINGNGVPCDFAEAIMRSL